MSYSEWWGWSRASGDGDAGAKEKKRAFEVLVLSHTRPGEPFVLVASGRRIMALCSRDAGPGHRMRSDPVRFEVPESVFEEEPPKPIAGIGLVKRCASSSGGSEGAGGGARPGANDSGFGH